MIKQVLNSSYTLFVYYVLVTIVIFIVAKQFPLYDWDVFPYVGSAKYFEVKDKQQLHDFVYSEAKKIIPKEDIYKLLGFASIDDYENNVFDYGAFKGTITHSAFNYRKTVSTNPEAFYQQLPFYQIKILYVTLIYLLAELGVDIYMATYMISTVSMAVGLWILLLTFMPYVHKYLLYSIPIFALAFGLSEMARLTNPDALAFLMVTIIIYLYTRGNWLIFIAAPVAVLVRPDLIIFGFIILAYYLIYKRSWLYYSIACIAVSMIFYLCVNYYFGNYGWSTLFYHTYFESLAYPGTTNVELSIEEVFNLYLSNFKSLIFNTALLCYVGLFVLCIFQISQLYSSNYKKKSFNMMIYILIASFLYISIHFLLFPSLSTRFFVAQYLMSAVVLLFLLSCGGQKSLPNK